MSTICATPNRSMEKFSRKVFQKRITPCQCPLRQEEAHSQSKRPVSRFAVKTDAKIQSILATTQEVTRRISFLKKELKSLEVKVEKLGTHEDYKEKQNQSRGNTMAALFQKLSLKSKPPSSSSSPSKLKRVLFPVATSDPAHNFGYLKDRKMLEMQLTTSWGKVKAESAVLKNLYRKNATILKYKRAEHCLQALTRIQRHVKSMQVEYSQLKDRLVNSLGNA